MKKTILLLILTFSLNIQSQTYFPFKKDGKWGVINRFDKSVHYTKFDSISAFSIYTNQDFTDATQYAIAYNEKYKKIINYKGGVLLDSLMNASHIRIEEDLVLKNHMVLPFLRFSKNNNGFGFYYPNKRKIIAQDRYKYIHFYFDESDKFMPYFYAYNANTNKLDIVEFRSNTLLKSVDCNDYWFDRNLSTYNYDEASKIPFIIVEFDKMKSILNFKGEVIIKKGYYKSISIKSNLIIVDNKQYNFKGEFIRISKNTLSSKNDEVDIMESVAFRDDEKELIKLSKNKYSYNNFDFKVPKKWSEISLITNHSERFGIDFIFYKTKDKYGIYNYKTKEKWLNKTYKSLAYFIERVDKNYSFFKNLKKGNYDDEKDLELVLVKNDKNKYNVFKIQEQKFIFENWHDDISVLNNYYYVPYFLVRDDDKTKVYDLNNNVLLDNIKKTSLRKLKYYDSKKNPQMKHYDNPLRLNRYIFVTYNNGDKSYVFINNDTWKASKYIP